MSLERRITPRLRVGLDYVPGNSELTPRAVYSSVRDECFGHLGTSSRRTSTEDGEQSVFGLVGRQFGRHAVYAGAMVEFRGQVRPVAGASIDLAHGVSVEPYYDGQFVHVGFSRSFGDTRVTVARSGTNRLSVGVSQKIGKK